MIEQSYIRLNSEPPVKKPPPSGFVDIFIDPETDRLVLQKPDGTLINLITGTATQWGEITGNLADQVELREILEEKADVDHDHDERYAPIEIITDRNEPTGFLNRFSSNLDFNSGLRRVILTPQALFGSFVIWTGGYRRTISGLLAVTIPDVMGLHYVYFNGLNLESSMAPWASNGCMAPVATVYWNGTHGIIKDERHGIQMDRRTAERFHKTRGPEFSEGLELTATNATFVLNSGVWFDDDMILYLSTQTAGRVVWRDGAGWDWTEEQTKWHYSIGSIPQWDDGGGIVELTGNRYFTNWLFLLNTPSGSSVIIVTSQKQHTSIAAARSSDPKDLDLFGLPEDSMLLCHKIIGKRVGAAVQFQEVVSYLSR